MPNEEAESLRQEIQRTILREDRVRAAYENGIDTIEEYKENRLRLQKQRESLEKELEELLAVPEQSSIPSREEALSRIRTVNDVLRNPDIGFEEKGVMLRTVLEKISFDGKEKKLYFDIIIS